MQILVIGKSGQLARALKTTQPAGHTARYWDRGQLNLSWEPRQIQSNLSSILDDGVDCVINAAAYTDVGGAEREPERAFNANARAVGVLAELCAHHDTPLIHVSTDYVFDGEKPGAYLPDDTPNPLNMYGVSKYEGERAFRASGVRGAIVRTSWVFDGQGKNFFTTIMNRAQTDPAFQIVSDQSGRPTYAPVLAEALWALVANIPDQQVVFHVCNQGPAVSWDDFARAFLSKAYPSTYTADWVQSVASPPNQGQVIRPRHSLLDVSGFVRDIGYAPPDWRASLDSAIEEWHSHRHQSLRPKG